MVVVDRLEHQRPNALEISDASIKSESLPVLHAESSFGPVVTAIFFGALGMGAFAWAWWLGAGALVHGSGAQSLPRAAGSSHSDVDLFSAEMNETWVRVAGRPQPVSPQDTSMDVDLTSKSSGQ